MLRYYFMIMSFIAGSLATMDSIQLYCGNDHYIKQLKVQARDSGGLKMWSECEGSKGRQTAIRYTAPGEK